jgi:hypothetical protein
VTVDQRFASLHQHPNCSPFFHEFLDLIQTEMLIVESDMPRERRMKAADLLRKIEELQEKCQSLEGYLVHGCLKQTTFKPLNPVEVALNKKAKNLIVANNMKDRLLQYSDRTRTANPRHERTIKNEV